MKKLTVDSFSQRLLPQFNLNKVREQNILENKITTLLEEINGSTSSEHTHKQCIIDSSDILVRRFSPKEVRIKLKLPGINKTKVSVAILIRDAIKAKIENLRIINPLFQGVFTSEVDKIAKEILEYPNIIQTQEAINNNQNPTTTLSKNIQAIAEFKRDRDKLSLINRPSSSFDKLLYLIQQVAPEALKDEEILALVIYYSVKKKSQIPNSDNSFLSTYPIGFFDNKERIKAVLRHCIVDVHGLNTPSHLEDINKWDSTVDGWGLGYIQHLHSIPEFLEIAFPGSLSGSNPLIRPWKLGSRTISQNHKRAKELTKQITRYLAEIKLQCLKDGSVNANKIREITDWNEQFNLELDGCVKRGGFNNTYEALKEVYPHLFGFDKKEQIKPWEIKHGNLWTGIEGKRLFRLAFAYSLAVSGLGKFKHDSEPLITFTESDLIKWKSQQAQNRMFWSKEFFQRFNLTGAFHTVANGNINRAFEILLGKYDKVHDCFGNTTITRSDIEGRNSVYSELISNCLSDIAPVQPISFNNDKNLSVNIKIPPFKLEGTFLEKVLNDKKLTLFKTILYEALIVSILPTQEKDDTIHGYDKLTALEKILSAKYPQGSSNSNKPIISEKKLFILLKILKNKIIDETNLDNELKVKLKNTIEDLLKYRPYEKTNKRGVLNSVIQLDVEFGTKNNLLSTLNSVLEYTLEVLLINELTHMNKTKKEGELTGEPTETFTRISEKIYTQLKCNEVESQQQEFLLGEKSSDEDTISNSTEENSWNIEFNDEPNKDNEISIETRLVYEGKVDENPIIIKTLLRLGEDDEYRQRFLRLSSFLLSASELRLIHQIRNTKIKPNDFNYRCLRTKQLPTTNINGIIDKEEKELLQSINALRQLISYTLSRHPELIPTK